MRRIALVLVAFVAGCGGGSSTQVGTTSTPPSGGGMGTPTPGGGGGGGTSGGGGSGGTAGGGGSGGSAGGGGSGGSAGGGGSGGSGGGGSGGSGGGAMCTLAGPTQLAASHAVRKMLVDGDQLYFLDVASAYAGVYRMPKSGGTPTLVFAVPPIQNDGAGHDFAVDDRAVYVTYGIDDSPGPNSKYLYIIDKNTLAERAVSPRASGCTVPVIAHLAAYAGTLWMTQHNIPPSGCSDGPSNTIEELDAGATQSRTLVPISSGSAPLFADATHVFWSGDQGTFRVLHSGASVEHLGDMNVTQLGSNGDTLFASDNHYVYAITAPGQWHTLYSGGINDTAVDDKHLYVAGAASVIAVDDADGSTRTIVPDSAAAVAVDATNVYYFGPSNSVWTVCKP